MRFKDIIEITERIKQMSLFNTESDKTAQKETFQKFIKKKMSKKKN